MSKPGSLSGGMRFPRGEVITRDGDPAVVMYIIIQGQAGVLRNYRQPGEVQVAVLGAGDFFGENSLFLGRSQTATLIAVTDVVAFVLTKDNVHEFFMAQPEFAVSIATALCQRLESASLVLESIYFEQLAPTSYAPPKTIIAAPPVKAVSAPAAAPEPAKTAVPLAAPPASPAAQAPTPVQAQVSPADPAPPAQREAAQAPRNAALDGAPPLAFTNPVPVEGASIVGPGHQSGLFLPGHKEYMLPLETGNNQFLFEKSATCPQCGKTFPTWAVRQSKLVAKSTDRDRRTRYNGVEPLYFDVITCPECWFSATADSFKDGAKRRDVLAEKLAPYRAELFFPTELEIDTMSVFAGHYLAIECAPVCYPGPNIVLGKLWQKLSRIYADCGDGEMEIKSAQKAHDFYMTAYTKTNISPRQNQQLCIIIAELAFKLDDIKSARNFFFRAKTDSLGNAVLKRHAEDRIEDVRAYMEAAGISE